MKGDADFSDTKIEGDAYFRGAKIEGDADFSDAKIEGDVIFSRATIEGDADFRGATIKKKFRILFADIQEQLYLKDANFLNLESEEEAYRKAKQVYEKLGSKSEADYHFYREMETKRVQKPFYIRYPELIVQYCFGYGVYPFRVIISWFTVVIIIAFIFYVGKGVQDADLFSDNLYFSVVTALTPGYGGYKPVSGTYQLLATAEAVFGTFMWAAFIATFARKFMR